MVSHVVVKTATSMTWKTMPGSICHQGYSHQRLRRRNRSWADDATMISATVTTITEIKFPRLNSCGVMA